jgi:hypothetical protein
MNSGIKEMVVTNTQELYLTFELILYLYHLKLLKCF